MYSVCFGFVPVGFFLNVLQVIKAKIKDGCYIQTGSSFQFSLPALETV